MTTDMIAVTSVEPVGGFVLRLGFSDGSEHELDLEPLLWGPVFEVLKDDPELFSSVTVDEELGTIVWPNGADLDPDVLFARATGSYDDLMRGEAASG